VLKEDDYKRQPCDLITCFTFVVNWWKQR